MEEILLCLVVVLIGCGSLLVLLPLRTSLAEPLLAFWVTKAQLLAFVSQHDQ